MAEWSPYVDGRVKVYVPLETTGACYARRTEGTEASPRSCYLLSVNNYDGVLILLRISSTGAQTQLASYQQTDDQEWFDETFWLQAVGTTIKVFNGVEPVERISVTDSTFAGAGAWGGHNAIGFEDMSAPAGVPASVFGSINALGRRLVT